ncbi:MAG: DUF2274 domain-containing protein [Alphaproteobacteria bacterium]|nr:DUF2274 domain-containing protein [Alphaproteobacteria bacterium]MDE2111526.1 DUF2274 domain-containing protein [Alphaproteobacteria bacterium]MDE2494970.1 DUF2274 domain-containing protein [Alphaproteobacteria bacterium]
MDLKLAKLPDRVPVKIAVTVSPQLARKLGLYAELYNAAYGSEEAVAELIPYMLESFLEADRNFAKAFKERELNGGTPLPPAQIVRHRCRTVSNESQPQSEE